MHRNQTSKNEQGRRGRDRMVVGLTTTMVVGLTTTMVVGLTTTYAISAYHHWH